MEAPRPELTGQTLHNPLMTHPEVPRGIGSVLTKEISDATLDFNELNAFEADGLADPTLLGNIAALEQVITDPNYLSPEETQELAESDPADPLVQESLQRNEDVAEFRRELDRRLGLVQQIAERAAEQRKKIEDLTKLSQRIAAPRDPNLAPEYRLSEIQKKNANIKVLTDALGAVEDPKARDTLIKNLYDKVSPKNRENFASLMEGLVTEMVCGEELALVADTLSRQTGDKYEVRPATTKEDTEEGFDFVVQITLPTGEKREVRFDAKSSGAFRKAMSQDPGSRMIGRYHAGVQKYGREVVLTNPTGFNNPKNEPGESIVAFQDLGGRVIPSFERNRPNQQTYQKEIERILRGS